MDALWYKDAIIYQVHVRSFYDSIGNGIGDFEGLTQKLDYVQDLGVTALWLMPFYPSPLRDDGYDIADYQNIHPQYGTLEAFRRFLEAAHDRDLKVVTELVINHTSDQHPWFQRARRAPSGSTERDFYVWSDTPEKYRGARIIFKDFETSNWTYDRVAKAYFWHRFYSHQPDLNYDNPAVWQSIFPLVDFWFEMGVDGLRLDAVPYLYEREGTNCENLPETHAFLKELRKHIDARFPGRMLLAEANQWPEDAVAYFGDGDECHMAFHFPVMPRMFMAVHREDRFPMLDIMDQTPQIPANCQWAMFLRNHDELTLEMVTDEERDYMYRAYASDDQARINLGIRRRLAPLMSNNRRRIELMNGLLFSLPGTPVLYYGDEIGMGDNIFLGDRNGVRTPMQWSADRNAGFSRANPQRLYLPINIDPEYHYEAVNVESQQNNPHSLLWWMKRLIDMRKRSQAFSRGSLEFLYPSNRKVLAFLRKTEEETLLVVANLSRFAQYVELDLSALAGHIPIEFFGETQWPPIGKTPYFLMLGPHSFYWFHLLGAVPESHCTTESQYLEQLPVLNLRQAWRGATGKDEEELEDALATYLSCALTPSLGRQGVKGTQRRDQVAFDVGQRQGALWLLDAQSVAGENEKYALPLVLSQGSQQDEVLISRTTSAVAYLEGSQTGLLHDASIDPAFCRLVIEWIADQRRLPSRGNAELGGYRMHESLTANESETPSVTVIRSDRHVLVNVDQRYMLKIFRRVEEGLHPELEFGRLVARRQIAAPVPPLLGALQLQPRRGEPTTVALVSELVPNEGDAWQYTVDALGIFFERVVTLEGDVEPPPAPSWRDERDNAVPEFDELLGGYLESARLLGQRTAELHRVLASDPDDSAFAPEPFSPHYQRSTYQSLRGQAVQMFDALERTLPRLSEVEQPLAAGVLKRREWLMQKLRQVLTERVEAIRLRCHGNLHLGQMLFTGKDFVITDFEGNPQLPLSERRIKRSPLRDVASMIQSFDYAARATLAAVVPRRGQTAGAIRPADLPRVTPWSRYWVGRVAQTFLQAYESQPGIAELSPATTSVRQMLLELFILERSMLDLRSDLHDRKAWVPLSLSSLLELLSESP